MKIECNKCGFIFGHYNNIYGTYCQKCGNFIKPEVTPEFIKKHQKRRDKLINKFIDKLRKKGV